MQACVLHSEACRQCYLRSAPVFVITQLPIADAPCPVDVRLCIGHWRLSSYRRSGLQAAELASAGTRDVQRDFRTGHCAKGVARRVLHGH